MLIRQQDTVDLIQSQIVRKTPLQVDGIRRSCRLAAATLDRVGGLVVEGVTTDEINDAAESFIRANGATPAPLGYLGGGSRTPFPRATCISLNEVICHGIPGDRVLRHGDILNIDVTTILDGFYGDTSRMFGVGPYSPEADALVRVTREALAVGIRQVRPGNRFGNIGYEIARLVESLGYGIVTLCFGHGVGIAFHEAPEVHHKAFRDSGPVMWPGMVFTVEPMVNCGRPDGVVLPDGWTVRTADGSLSAQEEHTVLVTDDGYEVLTTESRNG